MTLQEYEAQGGCEGCYFYRTIDVDGRKGCTFDWFDNESEDWECGKNCDEISDKEEVNRLLEEHPELVDLWNTLREPILGLADLCEEFERTNELRPPAPVEIKRRLKYAKNPMEIKQLNRQLVIAYKKYGKTNKKRGKDIC